VIDDAHLSLEVDEELQMGILRLARTALTAGAALTLGALSLSAQLATFSTTGAFSGGTSGTVCSATSCTAGGMTLSFANAGSTSYFAPTLVDLGQFVTQAAGASEPHTAFNGVTFMLTINQTAPNAGSGSFSGSVSGSLAYNPSTSSLAWVPTTTSLSIGFASYTLVTDNTGSINIQSPALGAGQNPNMTSVKAMVSVTPEPATIAMLAPALAGLGLVARARRRSRRQEAV
jgi:hypothetical protein